MNKKADMSIETIMKFVVGMAVVSLVLWWGGSSIAQAREQREKIEPWMVHPECRCDIGKQYGNVPCGQDGIYDGPITIKNGETIDCSKYGSQTVDT